MPSRRQLLDMLRFTVLVRQQNFKCMQLVIQSTISVSVRNDCLASKHATTHGSTLIHRSMTSDAHRQPVLPLDEGLYRLDDTEITFFKQQTGIDDSDELKAHLLSIQAEAYEVTLLLLCLALI